MCGLATSSSVHQQPRLLDEAVHQNHLKTRAQVRTHMQRQSGIKGEGPNQPTNQSINPSCLGVPAHQLCVLCQVIQTQSHGSHGDSQRDRHAHGVLQMLQDLQGPGRIDVDHRWTDTHTDQLRGLRLAENVNDLISCFLQRELDLVNFETEVKDPGFLF